MPVSRGGWMLALGVTGGLVLLATLPPFVGPETRSLLMTAFSAVCHQLPGRSPHVDGVALAVCHRCYGILWGMLLAAPGFFLFRRWDSLLYRHALPVLAVALVPAGMDWLAGVLGVWQNTPVSRLATGLLFGIVAGYYVTRGAVAVSGRRVGSAAATGKAAE
ncbi:DUF2085 domain-containing protein [Rhodocaloribacter litoris]|uniref:DUF2085 domain-containing protein n=1 Tax=Rhodocaloribacter litoris TaxID=2558931 RepID=UPI00141F47B8|nr:DUF2085 domain-containing protein [Rhodocaloribacter litoris]QXD16370.1 DUF2085 domain-containing protein [Rhodocaloribacter litoris]